MGLEELPERFRIKTKYDATFELWKDGNRYNMKRLPIDNGSHSKTGWEERMIIERIERGSWELLSDKYIDRVERMKKYGV